MTGREKKPNEPADPLDPSQQGEDDGGLGEPESFANIDPDSAANFANINPTKE